MKNSTIALDLLSLSVELQPELSIKLNEIDEDYVTGSIKLECTKRRTPNFKHIFNVYLNNSRVGELRTGFNKPGKGIEHSVFKFSNEILYSEQLAPIYFELKSALNWNFCKINAIDIALDQTVEPKSAKHLTPYKKYLRQEVDFLGRSEVTVQFKRGEIRNVYIGSRKSDKFVRCYYKRQELAVSNKHYIQQFWEQNGIFNPNTEIWRTELSLKGSIINKIVLSDLKGTDNNNALPFFDESNITLIQNKDFLLSIFRKETDNFLKYYSKKEAASQKNISRVKHYSVLANIDIPEPMVLLERIKTEASKMVHKIKMTAKFLTQISVETGHKIFDRLSDVIVSFEDLSDWKQDKKLNWIWEHEQKLKNEHYKRYMGNNWTRSLFIGQ